MIKQIDLMFRTMVAELQQRAFDDDWAEDFPHRVDSCRWQSMVGVIGISTNQMVGVGRSAGMSDLPTIP